MSAISDSKPLEVELQLPVRTYDIDFVGIVCNIVYVRWLEDLRLEMLGRSLPLADLIQNGIAPLILQTKIDYKQAIQMTDCRRQGKAQRPIGKMWVESLASLRWIVSAEIAIAGKIAAIAQQTGIFINLQTKKPIRIPAQLQQQYDESVSRSS